MAGQKQGTLASGPSSSSSGLIWGQFHSQGIRQYLETFRIVTPRGYSWYLVGRGQRGC